METSRSYVKFLIFTFWFGVVLSEDSWPLYRVATILHEPWVMKNDTGYKGFIVDLLEELSPLCEFHYSLQLTAEPRLTRRTVDFIHGQYESLVKDVEKKAADLGAANLMITDERLQRVTFSRPFISTGSQILVKKPVSQYRRTFSTVLLPFSATVWGMFGVCIVLVALLLYLIEKLICPSNEDVRRRFTLGDSFLFTICPIVFKGHKKAPGVVSGWILTVSWKVSFLAIVLIYAANLTSLFIKTGSFKPTLPFKTFTQLAGQSDVTYGGWFGMPLNPNDYVQLAMDRSISSRISYYTDINEAVSRVRKIDQSYAAIVSGTEGEYLLNKFCDVMLLREQLFPIDYAIACGRGLQGEKLCGELSMALDTLLDDGVIHELMRKWWSFDNRCPGAREDDFRTGSETNEFISATPTEVGLIFAILLCGMTFSVAALIVEVYRSRKILKLKEIADRNDNNTPDVHRPMLKIEPTVEDQDITTIGVN